MGMLTGAFTKRPSQKRSSTVNFATNDLAVGESIVGDVTVVATDLSTGTDVTSTVIETASVTESAGIVTVPVKAGTSRIVYKIAITAATDASPAGALEAVVFMFVADVT